MRLTVLGGDGGWPRPGGACSGYVVEHDGHTLLLDPGAGTFPLLVEQLPASAVDAVLVSHGHPDHVLDLNPLLRARAFTEPAPPPLPLLAPPDALRAVLALDHPGVLDDAFQLRDLHADTDVTLGPFTVRSAELPHSWPNLALRISAADRTLVYTGDSGPSPLLHDLARGADVLLAEASHVDEVPAGMAGLLSTAGQRADDAREADVACLVLTHLLPGEDRVAAEQLAIARFSGRVDVARPGLQVEVGGGPRE
jgi:ribonuclease BN (tRNA processing enzyme)